MKKSFFLFQLIVFLMVGLAAFAQTVTGVVMSEDGPYQRPQLLSREPHLKHSIGC